jgi:hypothetical protein
MSEAGIGRRAMVGLGAGAALVAAAAAGTGDAQTPSPATPWRPAFEPQDDWLERPGTRHRLVFDTITAKGAQDALFYADNFYQANKSAYGLGPDALGVVIVLRHMSTPIGYNDRIWAKYGDAFAEQLDLKGSQAIAAAHGNPLDAPSPGPSPKDAAATLATLAKTGVRFAVCGMATEGIAGLIAKKTGQKSADVETEFRANLIAGGLIVAAGVVAVNRAQEHGYAFAYAG